MNTNPETDLYIDKAAAFAKPILNHIRMLVHSADPRIQETKKWGMPFFEYKGTICHMAAFKNHCAMGFWKASLMSDDYNIFKEKSEAMGGLGKITSLADLPSDEILIAYIREAIELNEKGVKLPPKPKVETKELLVPQYFLDALQEDPHAMGVFQNFSPSNKKDYVLWLEEAKTEATRLKRLETAVEWIGEGKPRMWKYMKK
ncbi:YdeI/OmpD-associated family protein [Pedobacter sp. MW01-1-1]|uniref:YdeI/OmpD-associated family protein n=1 Tax=Pedobacter sp. MW01-1-1 TaxID=3383027 RepID=UPI003FEE181F